MAHHFTDAVRHTIILLPSKYYSHTGHKPFHRIGAENSNGVVWLQFKLHKIYITVSDYLIKKE